MSTPRLRLQEAQDLDVELSHPDAEMSAVLSKLETWREDEKEAALTMGTEQKIMIDPVDETQKLIEGLDAWRQELVRSREELAATLSVDDIGFKHDVRDDSLLFGAQHGLDKARKDQQRLARLLDRKESNVLSLDIFDPSDKSHNYAQAASATMSNLEMQLTRLRAHFEAPSYCADAI